MKQLFALLFIFAYAAPVSRGQVFDHAKMDSLFTSLSNNNMAMASIAVSKNGKIIYQRATGNAIMNPGKTIAANTNTAYRIGSITKMFTATIVFQLCEAKKLSLSDTLSRFFPQLQNAGRITIANMLYHRSGLPDFTKETNFDNWKDKPQTQEALLALIKGRKPGFEPNAMADYNNSNYLLLGFIIEKICNKPFRQVLNERIIKKLRLKRTFYGNDSGESKNEAASYRYATTKWIGEKAVDLDNFGGAGAIVAAPANLVRFIEALFSYKLVARSSLEKMQTLVDDYGMGMFPYSFQFEKGYGHNGKTEGFASSLSYYPHEKLAIAFCTNAEVYPKEYILNGVLAICFNAPYSVPGFVAQEKTKQQLDSLTGTYACLQPDIKVICSNDGARLQLEAKGQVFWVEAMGGTVFMNKQFGLFFEFHPDKKQLLIKEADSVYYLDKQ